MKGIRSKKSLDSNNLSLDSPLFSFVFLALPILFYSQIMSRTIGYIDAGLIMHNAYELNISAWVDNHNLYSLLSYILIKTFSRVEPFIVSNILSMSFGAFTVFFAFLLSKKVSNSLLIGGTVSIALMLSHSLAWHSTMLEVYTLNTFLIMVLLYCFYMYYSSKKFFFAYMGSFAWGLGLSNHIQMGLFIFAFISFLIFERKSISMKNLIIGLGCFLTGLSLFIIAFINSALRYNSIFTAVSHVTGGDFRTLMFSTDGFLFWTKNYLYFFLYQFSITAIIISILGFKSFFNKKPFSIFFLLSVFAQLIWSLNYHVWDIFAFSLPVYILLVIPMSEGLRLIRNKNFQSVILVMLLISTIGQGLLYKNIDKIKIVRKYINDYPMIEMTGNTFDPVIYFLNPYKRDFKQIDQYITQLFNKLPENAVVYDNIYDYPISYYYQNIKKQRQDIHCPIIFTFWVKNQEINRLSKNINTLLYNNEKDIYMSAFVFKILDNKLVYSKKDKFFIYEDEFLYHLKY